MRLSWPWPAPLSSRPLVRLGLVALAIHLLGAGGLPLLDRDEPRFAEAAREMGQRGDYVVPFFNAQERFDKPPLIYWAQAACYRLGGENEWTARLPSVLAAAGTALLVAGMAGALFGEGRTTGFWAGLVFTTSLQTLVHAKAAVADMPLLFFVTLATWAGWELTGRPAQTGLAPARGWWWAFAGALALGFLAKGPVALLPAGAAAWSAARAPDGGGWRRLALGRALLLTLGFVAPWGLPALWRTEGRYFAVGIGKHVVQRSLQPLEGHGFGGRGAYVATLPFYFVTLFASFFPWSVYLPGFCRYWWRAFFAGGSRGGGGGGIRFRIRAEEHLWVGVALTFLIFTPLGTKLPHYTLPALPGLALLFVRFWDQTRGAATAVLRRWTWVMAGLDAALALVVFPVAARSFPSPRLAREARPWLRRPMEFALAGYQEPSEVWYFRRWVDGFAQPLDLRDLPAFMARPGPRFCVLPTAQLERVRPPLDPAWPRAAARGRNWVHGGQPVDLTVVVKPE